MNGTAGNYLCMVQGDDGLPIRMYNPPDPMTKPALR